MRPQTTGSVSRWGPDEWSEMRLVSNEILWAEQRLASCAALMWRASACSCMSADVLAYCCIFLKWYNCCWTNTIVLISSVNSTSDDGDNGDASSGDDDISCLNLKNVHWQPNKGRGEMKELRMLCAEDEQGRTCWMTAFRLFKVTQRIRKCITLFLICSFS